jgi:hypothetical protein
MVTLSLFSYPVSRGSAVLAVSRVRKPRHCLRPLNDTSEVSSSARPIACGTSVQLTAQRQSKPPFESQSPSAFAWLERVRTGSAEPGAHPQAAAEAALLQPESTFQKGQTSQPATPVLWNQAGSQVKPTDPEEVERIMLNQGNPAAECDILLVLYQDDSKACEEAEGLVRSLPLVAPGVADCAIHWCATVTLSTNARRCIYLASQSELVMSRSHAL